MRNRSGLILAGLALGLVPQVGCDNKSEDPGKVSNAYREAKPEPEVVPVPPDTAFLSSAARANLAEVEAGRLAAKKSASEDVWRYSQHMITDHTDAQTLVTDLARRKGITLPTQVDDAHQKAMKKLTDLGEPAFDRAYIEQMVTDHLAAVGLFETNARDAKDPDVRAFAEKMLPKLREHLRMASDLKTRMPETTSP